MGNLKHRITVTKAREMQAEERNLTCLTCTSPTPRDGEEYCAACKSYWEGIAQGLWERDEP